jgi:hypothetical protein
LLVSLALLLSSCATTPQALDSSSPRLTASSYAEHRTTHGVVLVAIRWSRQWSCGGFENAELRSLAFRRLPRRGTPSESTDQTFEAPGALAAPRDFVNYAVLLEAGEYALTGFRIKVAKSTVDVDYLTAWGELMKDGGSFTVSASETVYIGNFFLDCHVGPTLWRFYTEGRANFQHHLAEFKRQYPYLDVEAATYRLFRTNSFGNAYELPESGGGPPPIRGKAP